MRDMNTEERIAELETKVAELLAEKAAWQEEVQELQEQLAQALAQIGPLLARVHDLCQGVSPKTVTAAASPRRAMGWHARREANEKPAGKRVGGSQDMKGITSSR